MSFNLLLPFLLTYFSGCGQPAPVSLPSSDNGISKIIPAAERIGDYLPKIKGKRVAVFANNTSLVGRTHLVDTLSRLGIDIRKIFAPEHGFRGTADAGEKVSNSKDPSTGIPVISLYGKKRKPSAEDLADVDIVLFDIQDVGARFYTYISSLEDLSESVIENKKHLIVLDRPNPNGFYVDGPVLDPKFKSFLGMQRIPVAHGMTIGEYILMLKGEKWIDPAFKGEFQLTVIPCADYTHESKYILPEKPSPNLPDMASIYLYPSTCLFEGTVLSEGRGTNRAFQLFGHPLLPDSLFSFTPRNIPGAKNPKLLNQLCYGWNEGGSNEDVLKKVDGRVQLKWLITAYKLFPGKDSFFIHKGSTFNRLAGNDVLIEQIRKGVPEEEIRKSWKAGIDNFKKTRKKYLLYKDFE